MNIAASFNKKYLNYAIVMFTSFCDSNPGHNNIFVMHSELDEADIHKLSKALEGYDVEISPIDVSADISTLRLPTTTVWSNEIYYRLLLPDKLPDSIDRLFYLDVDVIVHGSLKELYESDFDGADLMACADSNNTSTVDSFTNKVKEMLFYRFKDDFKYFNSGVLLLNIEKMRGVNTFTSYLKAMEEGNYEMAAPDQDILNYVHADKVKFISWEEYDLFARLAYKAGWTYQSAKEKNKIIHFAGDKPWNFANTHFELEKIWWDYAALTPVYTELMEEFVESAMSNQHLEKEAIRINSDIEAYGKAIDDAKAILDKFAGM